MIQILKRATLALISGLSFPFCQTSLATEQASEAAQDGSIPLSRSELYAYFAEHTQLRPNGHVFFSEFGTFQTLVNNEIVSGTWSSHEGGKMCLHFDKGDEGKCDFYVFDGEYVNKMINGVEFPAPEMVSGNTVAVKDMYTREETLEMISGNTVVWNPNGGAYYAPDGTLNTLWDGVREDGTWEVNDEGAVCWKVPSWGNTPCESYYRGKEGLIAIYGSEESPASEHREGNVLDSL